ncbi:SDR family NAD(P)-dependent oxidoreductase [Alkalinema sp. FACHB-956]|uniref:SDR family NAD(P)-dependent oxidoreductase n=1 Tax=Alkalinema sp. FACHB-956 TaxID=2692768 RepID=UPI0016843878|nr:SDR family NAD(P)-dependent oxidoreductase [Alkalinema sp. FACHB-956]MBD2326144.1 SDR family NAD(P)-dependent oxidoreductase [Alkalinema sp. FACHB-956]
MQINGKQALITGASRGIGRAIALEFAQQGASRLLLVARNGDRLQQVATEVRNLGAEASVLPLDLTDTLSVNQAITRAWQTQGPIDILVNCAGVAYQAPFLQSQLVNVQQEISTNYLGAYSITQVIARLMADRRSGAIVNVGSLMSKVAAPTLTGYSASKFALLGFTQALRHELAPYNIQVMALLPTLTDTDMAEQIHSFRGVTAISAQHVAKALVKGLQQARSELAVGWQGHLLILGNRISPTLVEWVVHQSSRHLIWASTHADCWTQIAQRFVQQLPGRRSGVLLRRLRSRLSWRLAALKG